MKPNKIICKDCGNRTKFIITNFKDDDNDWIEIVCKVCGEQLYYKGA